MPTPLTALSWDDPMDPSDIVDYVLDVSTLLADGEQVSTFTAVVPSDAALLGLQIKSTGGYSTTIDSDNNIRVWLMIADPTRSDFDGAGVQLPVEFTINTSSTPSRRRQRTALVTVQQR